jgi:hypothetical protein
MLNIRSKEVAVGSVRLIQFLGFVVIMQSFMKARSDMFRAHPEEICRLILVAVLYGIISMHDPGTFWNICMSSMLVLVVPHMFPADVIGVIKVSASLTFFSSVFLSIGLYFSYLMSTPKIPPTVRIIPD